MIDTKWKIEQQITIEKISKRLAHLKFITTKHTNYCQTIEQGKKFNWTLDKNDYGDKDERIFFKLFQCKDRNRRTNHSPLIELEWENVVKKEKKIVLCQCFTIETIQCAHVH